MSIGSLKGIGTSELYKLYAANSNADTHLEDALNQLKITDAEDRNPILDKARNNTLDSEFLRKQDYSDEEITTILVAYNQDHAEAAQGTQPSATDPLAAWQDCGFASKTAAENALKNWQTVPSIRTLDDLQKFASKLGFTDAAHLESAIEDAANGDTNKAKDIRANLAEISPANLENFKGTSDKISALSKLAITTESSVAEHSETATANQIALSKAGESLPKEGYLSPVQKEQIRQSIQANAAMSPAMKNYILDHLDEPAEYIRAGLVLLDRSATPEQKANALSKLSPEDQTRLAKELEPIYSQIPGGEDLARRNAEAFRLVGNTEAAGICDRVADTIATARSTADNAARENLGLAQTTNAPPPYRRSGKYESALRRAA